MPEFSRLELPEKISTNNFALPNAESSNSGQLNVVHCAIWYHLYNSKNVKNTHGGVLLLVKLQTIAYNFTKSNTPPWVIFTFFELYK